MGASCSMSGNLEHFENMVSIEHHVSGIGSQGLQVKGKGMLVFRLEDDQGQVSIIKLSSIRTWFAVPASSAKAVE